MYCWQARTQFADRIDRPALSSAAQSRLDRHLAACGSCRAEVEALRGVRSLLADAASAEIAALSRSRPARLDDALFEQMILRKARARQAPPGPQLPSFARPIPLGAALSLMIAAVALAHFLVGADVAVQGSQSAPALAASSSHDRPQGLNDEGLDDSVVPPREVPFVLQQDLVGARRGSIPLTTYVLEPAPREKPILRASL